MTIEVIVGVTIILGFIGSIIAGIYHISRGVSRFENAVEVLSLSVNELKIMVNNFDAKVDQKISAAKLDIEQKQAIWAANHETQHSNERHNIADKVSALHLDIIEQLDTKQNKK